jgi:hypothetical protein
MTDFTTTAFPEGAEVAIYPKSNWPAHVTQPTGEPIGTDVGDPVTVASGEATFEDLDAGEYWAVAELAEDEFTYVAFSVRDVADVPNDAASTTQAELEAAIAAHAATAATDAEVAASSAGDRAAAVSLLTRGQPGRIVPNHPGLGASGAAALVSDRTYSIRFRAEEDKDYIGIGFVVTTARDNADTVDVGFADATATRQANSGAVTATLGSTGFKQVACPFSVEEGEIYHAQLATDSAPAGGATPIGAWCCVSPAGTVSAPAAFGTTAGALEYFMHGVGNVIPVGPLSVLNAAACPYLWLIEDT